MALLARLVVFASVVIAIAAENPVAKVIKLLEDLKKEVESDGKKQASKYEKFACFCKDTTEDRSKSIKKGEDKINTLSGDIADDTASKEEKEAEVAERKQNHKELGEDLSSTVARCMTSQAEYERGNADMQKAIDSLKKAIKAMNAKKKAIKLPAVQAKTGKVTAKSLIEMDEDVKRAFALAGLDPSDPAYKYHSKEINDILAKLLKDFKDEKQDGQDKWDKTESACNKEKDGLNKKMKDNLVAISKAEEKIEKLAKEISKDRGDLVKAQELLAEDEEYLKDLTQQCEEKAKDFDQRASMRGNEVEALSQALEVLTKKVKDADKEVNRGKGKFIQMKPLSFLQAPPVAKAVTNFLARGDLSVSEKAMQESIVSLLRLEGNRLGSAELSMIAMQINAPDHFKKVKTMIQSLIERLLDEKKMEAAKKGWCDTEIEKAKLDRDHAQDEAVAMSAELKALEATKEELEAELKELKKEIEKAEKALEKATDLRKDEKEENEATLEKAQEGLAALKEAILILKAFYSSAKRVGGPKVLLQQDPPGAGFSGQAYAGKQKSSRAIFELLETIQGDFENTISKTEDAEAKSHAEFTEFERDSKSDIGSKETKTKLDKQDLKSTNTNIEKTLDDLKTTMGLQHDANKMIESLKPACLDAGGMNFKERSEKRDEEIAALNKAICILSPGKKEGECDK
jgi:DNA repair exonuclease SbcCD ATPase subunit